MKGVKGMKEAEKGAGPAAQALFHSLPFVIKDESIPQAEKAK